MLTRFVATLGAFLSLGTPALSDLQVIFLKPSDYRCRAGSELRLFMETGKPTEPERAAWDAGMIESLTLHNADAPQQNQPLAVVDDKKSAEVMIRESGPTLIGVNFKEQHLQISSDDLHRFVTQSVTSGGTRMQAISRDGQPMRVRRFLGASAVVHVGGDKSSGDGLPSDRSGLVMEIQPLEDPTHALGRDLPLRVNAPRNARLTGVIRATHVPSGKVTLCSLSREKTAKLTVGEPGLWRLEYHTLRSAPRNPDFDWVMYSATLTFEVTSGPSSQPASAPATQPDTAGGSGAASAPQSQPAE